MTFDESRPEPRRLLLAALAVVTDFVHRDQTPELDETEFGALIRNDELSDPDLVIGLINLCTVLLIKLEKAGQPIDDVLADIGLRYRRPSSK